MPTSCVVVDFFNHHQTGGGISFYRFPADNLERRWKWISFVSRQNEDGSPWEPADGDRVCSAHFISGKKSDDADDPDFVPSIYPKTASKKARPADTAELSVARFKCAKRRSLAKEVVELEERENHVARRKDEERCLLSTDTFLRHTSMTTGVTVAVLIIHQSEMNWQPYHVACICSPVGILTRGICAEVGESCWVLYDTSSMLHWSLSCSCMLTLETASLFYILRKTFTSIQRH